ncbi:MAG: polysaccharide deacetylase family protein [Verrucomicrobiales bacterium]|nr:polysaccharide deacetylase family protein [Planctomycetota bacterium]MCP5523492.1 polysaccharide deacetylase family protein [Verrucomicrobiales bacterium]
MASALGWHGSPQEPAVRNAFDSDAGKRLGERLLGLLTGAEDLDAVRPYPGRGPVAQPQVEDLHKDLAAVAAGRAEGGAPWLSAERWPGGRAFALLLSHDIDQIHDREMWRILADVNHVRRMVTQGEPGHVGQAMGRIARAVLAPKPATKDYETILALEAQYGFRSTFFVLHDPYWARQGARFGIEGRAIRAIAERVIEAGCEFTVHGGYYRFNNPSAYLESRETLKRLFGVEAIGIRNHLLRYSYPGTWRAQRDAGFDYDATYGYNCQPGPRSGLALPFFAYDREQEEMLDLLVLPLTVMDTTVFRYLRLREEEALELARSQMERYAACGGLVTLLWHGNYFNEPEYADWQWVYERLLEQLAGMQPWCATGAEINRWWRAREAVTWEPALRTADGWRFSGQARRAISGLTLRVHGDAGGARVMVGPAGGREARSTSGGYLIEFPDLSAGSRFEVRVWT